MAFLLFCGLLSICLSSVISAPIGPYKIIDMSYPYVENETIVLPVVKPYRRKVAFDGPVGLAPFVVFYNFETGEHVGTHMDAPLHFSKTGKTLDQVPLETTMGEAVVIDVTAKAQKNPDYLAVVSDFEDWEKKHGRMPDKPIVFLYTGYGNFWPDRKKYFGSNTPNNMTTHHYPGLHGDAAKWLVKERNLKMYGVDLISVDAGTQTGKFPVHLTLASHNIPGIENVANLHLLPPRGAEVFAAPMKMKDGSGGPTRLFARIGNNKAVSGGTALTNLSSCVVTILMATILGLFLSFEIE